MGSTTSDHYLTNYNHAKVYIYFSGAVLYSTTVASGHRSCASGDDHIGRSVSLVPLLRLVVALLVAWP